MMREYSFPAKTIFGCGSLDSLAGEIPDSSNLLLVLGSNAAKSRKVRDLMPLLQRFSPVIHTGVMPEPPLECVDEIIELGRTTGATAVAAIGGGSVMDAAKAAAALIPCRGSTKDYFSGRKKITKKGLFFAAIPTTSGTGAESTNNSVLTDAKSKVKKSLRHPSMKADLAIVDPELTLGCPASVTAASGLDALIQAIESFTSPNASSLTRSMSKEAVKIIFENLANACAHINDLHARTRMAEASMMSGLAFSQTGLGAIHGIAHPAGSLLKIPHGIACSIIMCPVMNWNIPAKGGDYAELARYSGTGTCSEDFVAACGSLAAVLKLPRTLKEYGITRRDFSFIIKNCRSASMKNNPRPMEDSDVLRVLEALS